MKAGAIALFGLLALAPAVQASETPLFVNATMCDAAAPIGSATTVMHREIRAERRANKRAEARPQPRRQAERRQRQQPQQAPVEQAEVPAPEPEAVLRPAVHFCVTPEGAMNPVRRT
ncbi:hypothetical protein [Roseomonas xinghualingensis]|uniref:hypothetical protein n=1 Tax=Roseomonas xinghualingensis TaxID=2986475 RepID=UPI0021F18A28|nr:hypothetical protein [Roseomonas sp. SXEYE001]MCV4207809.1 hypothetical protein [Roseomonas sp. SXEYE001]